MTKVNIYYGGRGLIEDPTIYVMDKITEVLNELNVVVDATIYTKIKKASPFYRKRSKKRMPLF